MFTKIFNSILKVEKAKLQWNISILDNLTNFRNLFQVFSENWKIYILLFVVLVLVSMIVRNSIVNRIYNKHPIASTILMMPGVVVHELSHLIACILCRVKIKDFSFFGNTFVLHQREGKVSKNFIIGIAPIFGCSVIALIAFLAANLSMPGGKLFQLAYKIVTYWIVFTNILAISPSFVDLSGIFSRQYFGEIRIFNEGVTYWIGNILSFFSLFLLVRYVFIFPLIFAVFCGFLMLLTWWAIYFGLGGENPFRKDKNVLIKSSTEEIPTKEEKHVKLYRRLNGKIEILGKNFDNKNTKKNLVLTLLLSVFIAMIMIILFILGV